MVEIPNSLKSLAFIIGALHALLPHAIPVAQLYGSVDDLFMEGPDGRPPRTLFQRLDLVARVLMTRHPGGVVRSITGTGIEQPSSPRHSASWGVSIADQTGSNAYSTIDPVGLMQLIDAVEQTGGSRGASGSDERQQLPYLFAIGEHPSQFIDSNAAFASAEAVGGSALRLEKGGWLAAAALACEFSDRRPLWAMRYSSQSDPTELVVFLDARSGALVWSGRSMAT